MLRQIARRAAVSHRTVSRFMNVRLLHVQGTKDSVQDVIKNNMVVVFSKTYCPYCARVNALFEDLEVKHEVVELDEHAQGSEIQAILFELTNQRTVPNVFIKGKHIGGCDAVTELYAQKKLHQLLE